MSRGFREGRTVIRVIRPLLVVVCCLALTGCAGLDLAGLSSGKAGQEEGAAKRPVSIENQQFEIRNCMARIDGVVVEPRPDSVIITIGCDVLFEKDTPMLRQAACGLEKLAELLKQYPDTKVKVDAHTDCMRSEEENFLLSELRAWAVKESMALKGLDPTRITARGWGESKPAASNATEEGRMANRRLTITLIPRQS
ncbi:MAG: OmpA family protein [Syntrophobacteraceae bacterium]